MRPTPSSNASFPESQTPPAHSASSAKTPSIPSQESADKAAHHEDRKIPGPQILYANLRTETDAAHKEFIAYRRAVLNV
jgi:hypothetical protein